MRGRYVTARRLAEVERTLSDRDRAVLTTLVRVRVATTLQLERLHFAGVSRRRSRQVLAGLADRQLLTRTGRIVGGVRAGSSGYVWTLGVAGHRLMRPMARRAGRPWHVSPVFLAHSLDVTALYTGLVLAEQAGLLRLIDFAGEPACWRTFSGPGGGRIVLKPDAFLKLGLGRYEDHWFAEVDRGTESRPTLARKLDRYRQYWQSGSEQASSGIFPRVLWLVPDEARRATLTEVIGAQPVEARPLFAVALLEEATGRFLRGAGA